MKNVGMRVTGEASDEEAEEDVRVRQEPLPSAVSAPLRLPTIFRREARTGWKAGNVNAGSGNHAGVYCGPGKTPGTIKIASQNNAAANGAFTILEFPLSDWAAVETTGKNGEKSECSYGPSRSQ